MQRAYITALCEVAEKDSSVLSLLADSGTGYDELFRRYFPGRLIDFGIAEENMVAAASGLAACGKTPFVYTAGAFLSYRSLEFIRDDICFQQRNVKLVGMGTGLAWSTLGATHHTTEDLGILRSLPGLVVLTPSCPEEVKDCVRRAWEIRGPVYIRIGMSNEKDPWQLAAELGLRDNGAVPPFEPGRVREICRGSGICVYVTGAVAAQAVLAAKKLAETGQTPSVYDVHTIKPFDAEHVAMAAQEYSRIVTIEEHSICGGLGSAAAEVMAERGARAALVRIGLNDRFASGYGTHEQVQQKNGLDAESIYRRLCDETLRNGSDL